MVVYFSGTGNSRCVAQLLAQQLGDELLDAGTYFKGEQSAALRSETPWVFVCPTYAWRLPRVFSDFIARSRFDGSRDAYFVMTCGSDIGGAAKYIVKLCQEKELRCRGVAEVVMPENYLAMFPVPDKETAERIVNVAVKRTVPRIGEKIAAGEALPTVKIKPLGMLNSNFNGLFYAVCVKDKQFAATDKCVGCGVCVEKCQLGNITLTGGKPAWHGNCTHCMACICSCPEEAIEYGVVSKGKWRYQCPEV